MTQRQQLFDDLRTAIWATTPASGWKPEDTRVYLDLVQGCLKSWADDIERSLGKADRALQAASAAGVTQEGADLLETCLMHEVAAREKLIALLAQFLGVPSLDRYKKGVRFFPRENRVRHELQERAKLGSAEAGQLLQALITFDQLDAVVMRNQFEHSISFLPQVTEICWILVRMLKPISGEPDEGEMHHLLPEKMLELPDITADTLFEWVEESAVDALQALDNLADLTGKLVAAIGELVPVQPVYRIAGREGVFLEIPDPSEFS
jgi:hypothetical protein